MSERYWITGAQLGLLIVADTEAKRQKLVDEIIDKQFICNCFSEEAKRKFEVAIRELAQKSGEGIEQD